MRRDVLLPQWGMGMTEGTVLEWYLEVGEHVAEGDALAEIEAAKAQVTLEAPYTGELVEILVADGETVEVRSVLARIETDTTTGPGEAQAR